MITEDIQEIADSINRIQSIVDTPTPMPKDLMEFCQRLLGGAFVYMGFSMILPEDTAQPALLTYAHYFRTLDFRQGILLLGRHYDDGRLAGFTALSTDEAADQYPNLFRHWYWRTSEDLLRETRGRP